MLSSQTVYVLKPLHLIFLGLESFLSVRTESPLGESEHPAVSRRSRMAASGIAAGFEDMSNHQHSTGEWNLQGSREVFQRSPCALSKKNAKHANCRDTLDAACIQMARCGGAQTTRKRQRW
jgi:hypothetical protein